MNQHPVGPAAAPAVSRSIQPVWGIGVHKTQQPMKFQIFYFFLLGLVVAEHYADLVFSFISFCSGIKEAIQVYYIGVVKPFLCNSNLRSESLFIKVVKSISLYLSCVN